ALDSWLWIDYELIRHRQIPDSSIADPVLFLHVVPFLMALAARPELGRPSRGGHQTTLNLLLLLFVWVFLYAFLILPFQFLPGNSTLYSLRYNVLYFGENLVLIATLGFLVFRSPPPWKSLYWHLLGASALYASASLAANTAIATGGYSTGHWTDRATILAFCWLAWIPLRARALKAAAPALAQGRALGLQATTVLALLAVLTIPVLSAWELFQAEDWWLHRFRILAALCFMMLLALAAFVKRYAENRELKGEVFTRDQMQRALIEASPEPIVALGREGKVTTWNAAAERVFGWAESEVLGQPLPSGSLDELQAHLVLRSFALGGQGINGVTVRCRRKDGAPVDLILSTALLHDSKGEMMGAVGVMQDVTERKRAVEALRESEEKYRSLVSNIPDVSWTLDATRRFVFVSSNIEKISGFSRDEVYQRGAQLYLSSLHPDDLHKVTEGFDALFAEGRAFDVEVRVRRTDGKWRWVHHRALATYEKNGLRYADGLLSDITERKQAEEALRESEEKYRSLVSNIPDVSWTVDANLRFVFVSDNIERASGFSQDEIYQGGAQLFFSSLHPEDLPKVTEGIRALFAENRPFDVEIRIRRKDDGWRWVHHRALATYEKNGIQYADGLLSDITERKQAEEALRDSEERFRSLVQNATVGIYRTTPEGRILMANPALVRMLGFEDFAGLAARNLQEEGFQAGYSRRLFCERMEKDGEVRGIEDRWTRNDGSVIFVRESARVIRSQDGTVLCYDGIVEDISERKRAEQALRLAQCSVEYASDAIHWLDPQGRIVYVNEAACRSLEYSREELLSLSIPEIDPLFPQERWDKFWENVKQRGSLTLETQHRTKYGRVYPVEITANYVEFDGREYNFAFARDITERKRAEAEHIRLVTAIEQSAEGVVITRPNGDIEYINPAFTQITGYTRDEVMGRNPRIVKSGKHDLAFYQQLWATILSGQTWRGELINRRKDGKLYTEQMNVSPLRDEDGKLTHFIATKQDVTERKALEEHVRQSAKMEAIGRLAGGVAHDFNNLLTIINGYSELLLEQFGADERASGYVSEVKNAGVRAASLTRQLLAFSRRQVLAPQVLDLNTVVSSLEKMLRRLIGEDVILSTALDPLLWRVRADPGQIEQVIMNLVVNARDAMPAGGHLTLETGNVELDEAYAHNHVTVKPGPHVMLAVSDTGMGMAPETKAHIFEPFFTTKEEGKGTGLGLATVYGIVKQSGGSIWVYSELGQGTVFKVYFPTVAEDLAADTVKGDEDAASGTETILVVEDQTGVRSLIRLALESVGYEVLDAEGPESALSTCASHRGPIHLLLTDVVMPGLSGPLVAEKVIALRPDIKVVYMSGYTDEAVVHHGVLGPDVPFIQKPLSPAALRKKIREVLGRK
ncbi:MAG: PAS domain S-box protein, partial [Terriglobia bacterium]